MEALFTSIWEPILNSSKCDDTNCECKGDEEQRVDSGPTPDDEDNSVTTTLQQMVADEVQKQVENAMAPISELVEKAVEQPFQISTIKSQGLIFTVVHDTVKYFIIDQIWTTVLEETTTKYVDK